MKKEQYVFQWAERCSFLIADCWIDTHGPYLLNKPKVIDYIIFSHKRYAETYCSKSMVSEWISFSEKLLHEEKRNEILAYSLKIRKENDLLLKKIQKTNLKKCRDKELWYFLEKYISHIKIFSNLFSISTEESLHAIMDKLKEILQQKGEIKSLDILVTHTEQDKISKEQEDLQKIFLSKKISDEILHEHALKNSFLFYNTYSTEAAIEYLKRRSGEPFDPKKQSKERTELAKKQKAIFRKINNKEIESICIFLQKLSMDRLELKDAWAGGEFRFLNLFQEISNRLNLELVDMLATHSVDDYKNALTKRKFLSNSHVTLRKKAYTLRYQGKKTELFENPKYIKNLTTLVKIEEKIKESTQLKGMSASKGVARGIVRIVKSIDVNEMLKDMERFKRGDVLVTTMTQPNMVPIARMAAAILADEGGITSHAAVIAREFGVPCIVGIRSATRVLKDGDLVEVDANTGVIRRL